MTDPTLDLTDPDVAAWVQAQPDGTAAVTTPTAVTPDPSTYTYENALSQGLIDPTEDVPTSIGGATFISTNENKTIDELPDSYKQQIAVDRFAQLNAQKLKDTLAASSSAPSAAALPDSIPTADTSYTAQPGEDPDIAAWKKSQTDKIFNNATTAEKAATGFLSGISSVGDLADTANNLLNIPTDYASSKLGIPNVLHTTTHFGDDLRGGINKLAGAPAGVDLLQAGKNSLIHKVASYAPAVLLGGGEFALPTIAKKIAQIGLSGTGGYAGDKVGGTVGEVVGATAGGLVTELPAIAKGAAKLGASMFTKLPTEQEALMGAYKTNAPGVGAQLQRLKQQGIIAKPNSATPFQDIAKNLNDAIDSNVQKVSTATGHSPQDVKALLDAGPGALQDIPSPEEATMQAFKTKDAELSKPLNNLVADGTIKVGDTFQQTHQAVTDKLETTFKNIGKQLRGGNSVTVADARPTIQRFVNSPETSLKAASSVVEKENEELTKLGLSKKFPHSNPDNLYEQYKDLKSVADNGYSPSQIKSYWNKWGKSQQAEGRFGTLLKDWKDAEGAGKYPSKSDMQTFWKGLENHVEGSELTGNDLWKIRQRVDKNINFENANGTDRASVFTTLRDDLQNKIIDAGGGHGSQIEKDFEKASDLFKVKDRVESLAGEEKAGQFSGQTNYKTGDARLAKQQIHGNSLPQKVLKDPATKAAYDQLTEHTGIKDLIDGLAGREQSGSLRAGPIGRRIISAIKPSMWVKNALTTEGRQDANRALKAAFGDTMAQRVAKSQVSIGAGATIPAAIEATANHARTLLGMKPLPKIAGGGRGSIPHPVVTVGQIKRAQALKKIDSDPYASTVYEVESGRNDKAKNPKSSAGGPFGFIDRTAKAVGLKNKYDLGQAYQAFSKLTQENAGKLGTTDPRTLYAAHFLGEPLLTKVLKHVPITDPDDRAHILEFEKKALPHFISVYNQKKKAIA